MATRSRWAAAEGSKFPSKSAVAALTGTTWVELVGNPGKTEALRVESVFADNEDASSQVFEVAFNKNGTRTTIWRSAATSNGACFTQASAGAQPVSIDITLANTNESLDVRVTVAGTSNVIAAYEVREGS